MTVTITWTGTLTALSSVAHGGETRGTITLLRRELVVQQDGSAVHVPLVSGNAFRGRLRRIGEELLRDELRYEGQLPLAAAHALRAGGALAKVAGEPLSGERLRRLRALVPHIGVFGCAAGGRIIDGCLQVGKVLPHVAELAHIIPVSPTAPTVFQATQLEQYTRHDDASQHGFAEVTGGQPQPDSGGIRPGSPAPPAEDGRAAAMLMMFSVETFPAGTRFAAWLRLTRAMPAEVSFFKSVLDCFQRDGRIGGRAGSGHGRVATQLVEEVSAGAAEPVDWRDGLREHRDEALAALRGLT